MGTSRLWRTTQLTHFDNKKKGRWRLEKREVRVKKMNNVVVLKKLKHCQYPPLLRYSVTKIHQNCIPRSWYRERLRIASFDYHVWTNGTVWSCGMMNQRMTDLHFNSKLDFCIIITFCLNEYNNLYILGGFQASISAGLFKIWIKYHNVSYIWYAKFLIIISGSAVKAKQVVIFLRRRIRVDIIGIMISASFILP